MTAPGKSQTANAAEEQSHVRVTAMRRSLLILAFLGWTSFAAGAQLKWSTGATNITVGGARACTLMVRTPVGQPLPTEWHLLWVTTSTSLL